MRQAIFTKAMSVLCFALVASPFALAGEAEGDDTANKPEGEPPALTESVVVRSIRADDEAPVTKTNITRDELAARNRGQEMPFLLQSVPSVTLYSDSGAAAGYSYVYLRGLQHTRINFTFDGVPLNEPEDYAAYFSDYGNLAASVQSVQVQRGVGTSTFGAASFAGSINFASLDLGDEPAGAAELSAGSYDTLRASVGWQTGLFAERWKAYARVTQQSTDGFRESSGVTQGSVYYAATRQGDQSSLKISGFYGRERTQLAFLAVEPAVLEENLRANPLTDEERDRFEQYLAQATWTRALSPQSSVSLQGYYQGAGGWYRLWADPERTALYEYGLHWGFFGGSASWRHAGPSVEVSLGAHANDHDSRHTRDIVDGARDYLNRGFKSEANAFAKVGWKTGAVRLFADAQVRNARLKYEGDVGEVAKTWTFFNPKAGARFELTPTLEAYVSAGRTEREPARSDLLYGADNASVLPDFDAVRPERVVDYEAGLDWRAPRFTLHANLYDMEFHDEIALTGELSDVGLPVRRNVERSWRRGVEFDASWQIARGVRALASAAWSRSQISSWTQFYDVYDDSGAWVGSTSRTYTDVEPLLSPQSVANLGVEATPAEWIAFAVTGRRVDAAFLDNTNNPTLRTPAFTLVDLRATIPLERAIPYGRPQLRIQVDNLLDEDRAWPSGYSYLYATRDAAGAETLFGAPYYYPLATRSIFVGVDFRL